MQKRTLENTVVILFHGGTYGKYLYWVLNNFTTRGLQNDLDQLLDCNGSSHEQLINEEYGPMVTDQKKWYDYKNESNFIPYYARHIIEGANNYLEIKPETEILDISNTVHKGILIETNTNNKLQDLNNVFEKTFNDPNDYFNIINHFDDFKVNTTKMSEVREMLSYKLFYLEYRDHIDEEYSNIFKINVNDLLYNFSETIISIIQFLNTELTIPLDVLMKRHSQMIATQPHLNRDADINHFLKCFEQGISCKLPMNSTIIDEAYIQNYLRNELELEIKCHNLEVFPRTVDALKKLSYPAREMFK